MLYQTGVKGKNSAQAPSYSQVSKLPYTKLLVFMLQIIPAIPMCWETLPESTKSNSILSHSAKSQERAWTVMQRIFCCSPGSQPHGMGPYRLQHHLQFTQLCPCCSTGFSLSKCSFCRHHTPLHFPTANYLNILLLGQQFCKSNQFYYSFFFFLKIRNLG